MNHEQFLHQFRESPRQEMVERIIENTVLKAPSEKKQLIHFTNSWKRIAAIFVVGSICSLILFTSPEVRAQIDNTLRRISGILVLTTQILPEESFSTPQAIMLNNTISIEQAQSFVPFKLPTLLPANYEIAPYILDWSILVVAAEPDPVFQIRWINDDHEVISLITSIDNTNYDPDIQLNLGEDNYAREVLVNRQPALLYNGSWEANQEYDPSSGIRLIWTHNGIFYSLFASDLEDVEIISIAESIE